ncbi:BnaA09g48280D [Brassica napus]|uniref:BnaA09g48280D protein n=2 Tax=Brassica napus TaxID=3708 RepID=A0A078HAV3_BRANA|nr:BnaA09g48280D [Brassica napus]
MAVSCVSGYGVYKVYHSLSVTTKRKRLIKILGAFLSAAETMTTVSQDVKRFLNSDSDNMIGPLKQIAKIATSDDFESTGIGSEPSVVDRVIDKAFSEEGGRFVSVVVGSFAKNLVLGFRSNEVKNDSEETPQWVRLLCDDKCRELLADCIERFTRTAVSVYLDKTMDINTYDQIFEGLTNPKHQDSVKDLLVTVSSGALQTIVRTSHDVFTSSSSRSNIEEIKTRC